MFDDLLRAIENLARSFQEQLSVRTVYGEPVTANGITVVPAARVSFGFGGGGGGGTGSEPIEGQGPEAVKGGSGGGGGGGGGLVQPLGYIEISDAGSRWVPLERPRTEQMLRAFATLAALAPIGRRRGRGLLLRGALLIVAQVLITQLFATRLAGVRR